MKQYIELINDIFQNGNESSDRTGVGTLSVFGRQLRFNLSDGFPLLTTKKIYFKGVVHELLWFLKGDTNIKYLTDNNVHIWDEWADKNGNLGPVYGKQWRNWGGCDGPVDQVTEVIEEIKRNPSSRRLIVSAWNPIDVDYMALPPCHCLFQFHVSNNRLSCQLYQRSVDVGLGMPFNIASYALLTHLIAQVCDLGVGEFIHTSGNAHIYMNHIAGLKDQIKRDPLTLCRLQLNENVKNIDDFKYEDIKLIDYRSHPAIKLDVAV